jgi:hypothetical protein
MSIVEDMLCAGGLWGVTADVSDVFLVSLFQVGWFGLYRCVDMFYMLVYRFRSCYILGFYCFVLLFYRKLHLLVYLLEYMKMHGPGNIKNILSLKINNSQTCSLCIYEVKERGGGSMTFLLSSVANSACSVESTVRT